jgi:hypothetical protein
MTDDSSGEVPVTFAKGVLDDVADLTATAAEDDQARKDEAEALKRRIAELLVECKGNPFIGDRGAGRKVRRAGGCSKSRSSPTGALGRSQVVCG